jgi:hypothetical protein
VSDEKLTPERAVRLLRAKTGELENYVKQEMEGLRPDTAWLAADIALIATLLADHIERSLPVRMIDIEDFREGFDEGRQPWGPDHPDYDEIRQ